MITMYVQKRRLDKNVKSDIKLLIEISYLREFSRWPYGSNDHPTRASFNDNSIVAVDEVHA
jgi:hypothetical protein